MKLSEYKDIIKQAIANEVEAKQFYTDAANTLKDPHLKKLFASLAEEEKKHRDILTKIYTANTMDRYFSESRDYKVAETMDEPELSMDMKPADAFALAMKKEEGPCGSTPRWPRCAMTTVSVKCFWIWRPWNGTTS